MKLLLVEKRLDQLGSSRDVRFGRSQEGAWRQKNPIKRHQVPLIKAEGAGCYRDSWSWR